MVYHDQLHGFLIGQEDVPMLTCGTTGWRSIFLIFLQLYQMDAEYLCYILMNEYRFIPKLDTHHGNDNKAPFSR